MRSSLSHSYSAPLSVSSRSMLLRKRLGLLAFLPFLLWSCQTDDPIGARRIINGNDKAKEIAAIHAKFLNALT